MHIYEKERDDRIYKHYCSLFFAKMGFEEFLPESEEEEICEVPLIKNPEPCEKISPNQIYGIITSKKPDWQAIIYDLINSEQLDPWDIDIVILTRRYFEKIIELEDEPDFYVSSRVLLAAALLLRIKSEFLLNRHLRSIDSILFGGKNEEKKEIERIEIDEDELPLLIPKTPMARMRRVTLPELMAALDKAINTESRRIKREVAIKRAHKLAYVDIPQFKRIDLKDRIKQIYARILTAIKRLGDGDEKDLNKIGYSELVGKAKEERIASFLPILHLSNSQELWLEQEGHLSEIWIYLHEYFNKNKGDFIQNLQEDIEEMKEELENEESIEPESVNGLEKARAKLEERKKLEDEVRRELEQELGKEISDIAIEREIEEVSGFSDGLRMWDIIPELEQE